MNINRSSTSRLKKTPNKLWLVVASLLLLGIITTLGVLITDQAQETCSFGEVTNEQYRELKKAISEKIEAPEFGTDLSVEAKLAKAFGEFVGIHSNIYKKLAASHAVLRIWGAQYRNTNGLSANDTFLLGEDPTKLFVTQIYYRAPTNPWVFFLQLGQGWRIFVGIAGPNAETKRESATAPVQRGTFEVTVNLPSVLLDGWKIPSAASSCPPLPRPQDALNFTAKQF